MIWMIMITCGLLTFATRFVMFSDIAPKALPKWLQDALGFVPVAVLTAIIVPAVIIAPDGGLQLAGNARLPAALIAVTMALLTRSVVITIGTGLAAAGFSTGLSINLPQIDHRNARGVDLISCP